MKNNVTAYSSDRLLAKICLSISVNIILIVGVSFLVYETGFSTGSKLTLLNAGIVAAYLTAIALHMAVFKINPLPKNRWIFILITLLGMIPHVWYAVIAAADLIGII
ncbi:MAG: hypothetical protein K2K57_04780 [Oscillospiraceae bacterium]|nr:hypothetical protein [Oscillospiraceae bacterium]